MAELSFLTIIVSLAVCSLLVYGIFQYMKVRLTVLEQSHREQAMILQQYIEESSSDIHRLYQISTERSGYGSDKGQPFPPNGSIILEYQEEQRMNDKPNAYNEPHTIHLDTAFFQNKRTNHLIEISSNSENTTDSEDDDDSDSSSSDSESESDSSSESSSSSESDSESSSSADEVETTEDHAISTSEISNLDDTNEICEIVTDMITNISYDSLSQSTDVKTVTVDLGTIETDEDQSKKLHVSNSNDVLNMMYKKAQQTPLPEDSDIDLGDNLQEHNPIPVAPVQPSAPIHVPLSSMSVPDLKQLLKELCKNQPEKHAEIQRLKKTELIYAIKQQQQQ